MDPAELDQILHGLPKVQDANVLLGYSHKDDAAVYRLPSGERLVQTVDFFTPVVDDPYDYGAIAAANSLSDIYAMNGKPIFALNICCFPRKYPAEIWNRVLRGGAEKAMEAGIPIVGGHTVDDTEPKYGLVVTGLIPQQDYWSNEGARVGDALILTKPIGTGLLTTALKSGELTVADVQDAIDSMKRLNRDAAAILAEFDVHACTDITGNGLIGHAWEICEASRVGMEFNFDNIPFFTAVRARVKSGKFPGGTFNNQVYYSTHVKLSNSVPEDLALLLYDAQTSGGLLAALPVEQSKIAFNHLTNQGLQAAIIGKIISENEIRVVT
jgi:selenium donor protein